MKKFVCSVCGYVHEGETAPDFCPICKAPKEKFVEQAGEKSTYTRARPRPISAPSARPPRRSSWSRPARRAGLPSTW